MTETRHRLDQVLVARGLVATRSRARDLIARGAVTVRGKSETRPAAMVAASDTIVLEGSEAHHVSRGAVKLAAALDAFGFEPSGRHALDVGASTGGFTQVLLERGAAHVTALDVGHGQLHPRLAADPRVTHLEGRDARTLRRADLAAPPDAIVCDVSFISLTLVLPAVLPLAAPGAWLVALIKPQFEVGRTHVGKGGIVRDDAARQEALERIGECLGAATGWHVAGRMPSPITGGDGNTEFLIGARHEGATHD